VASAPLARAVARRCILGRLPRNSVQDGPLALSFPFDVTFTPSVARNAAGLSVETGREHDRWGPFDLFVLRESPERGVAFLDRPERNLVILNLGGRIRRYEASLHRHRFSGAMSYGDFTVVPRGETLAGEYRGPSIAYAVLALPEGGATLEPALMVRDPFVLTAIERMTSVLGSEHDLDRVLAESVGTALAAHLSAVSGRTFACDARLGATELAKLGALVRDRLSEAIGVDDLAAAVGRRRTSFLAAFRQSTGTSPARWVQEQRLLRAYELVTRSRLPLVRIAHMTGFSSQSHLTRAFAARYGLTPGRLR